MKIKYVYDLAFSASLVLNFNSCHRYSFVSVFVLQEVLYTNLWKKSEVSIPVKGQKEEEE